MSTRSQVKFISNINEPPIYLYQHFDGYALYKIVCNAIAHRARWNDADYLCRIIFSEMINTGESWNSETGYGIGTTQAGDIEYLVEVNVKDQTIIEWEGFGTFEIKNQCTFEEARHTPKETLYDCN